MAGNLDKALLQMAGFEDEGDLYAKAADKWSGDETKGYLGKTGIDFQTEKDIDDDAANWGFKDSDARLNALLYAWSKDNPGEQITPELIDRMRFFATTADSMRASGGFLWGNGTPNKDENVKALIKLIQKHPEKANSVLGKDYNKYNSSIQNYFDWAGQYMNENTSSSNWENLARNFLGGDFADNVAIASRNLGDKLNTVINTPTPEEIARNNIEADRMKIAKDKAEHERRRKAGLRAGLSDIDDPNDNAWKTAIPDEWFK